MKSKKKTTRKRNINNDEVTKKIEILLLEREDIMKNGFLYTAIMVFVLLIVLASVLLINHFSRKPIQHTPVSVAIATNYIKYQVKPNDTLWDLSKTYYSTYSEWPVIYFNNKNRISFPDLIVKYQEINIPKFEKKSNFYRELGDMYFELYKMYRKIGWKKHAEGMLYMSSIPYTNIFYQQLGHVDNEQYKKDLDNLMKGKELFKE